MPKYPQSHLDPKLPLVLDTRDLPRQPGSTRALTRVVPAPSDLGGELIAVPEGADLTLELSMTSVSEGVYVSGVVRGPVKGECGRCLQDIDKSYDFEIQELFLFEESEPEERSDDDDDADEAGRMQGDLIDLEPAVRDAVVLALPVNPLCRPDCPGLCPGCGVRLDELPADHSHELDDPRWAALRNLSKSEE
ncbi:MAG TPA: DUF177 domain-containing protein [Actinoplanes sp.]|nr:DUF177 domain-containing protein [Actinoplanes sp.]